MATYATYFHFPAVDPMVHSSPHQSHTAPSPYPAVSLSLKSAESQLLKLASGQKPSSALSAPQRLAVSTRPKRTMNSQSTSLFFRLPAELRNTIYTALLCPGTLRLRDLAMRDKDLSVRGFNQTSTAATLFPQILSTCKKIHEEAQGLLYSTHVFHAHQSLLTSLPHLSSPSAPVLYPQVTSQIRRWQISIRLDTDPRFTYAQATAAFSNAEYVQIHVWQAQYDSCDYSVLRLFTGVRGVLVARVGGSVDPELAGWLEERMMSHDEESCECVDEEGDTAMWEAKKEVLCGRCYRKVGAGDWLDEVREEVWRFGGGARI